MGGHESSPATAAYTASRHRGKRHGPAQRLRRHQADAQDPEHAARGACLAREVEQAVAVVLVLLIPCLDLGGEAVGQRCREGVEAVEDVDDLPLGGDGWGRESRPSISPQARLRLPLSLSLPFVWISESPEQ